VLVTLGIGREGLIVGLATAQDEVRNFRKPILMVETGGHHARVRSLIWQDDFTLLSGGEDKVVKVWDFHDGVRLARSIRPPIWRGPGGTIYALAMTKPDAQGQSYLATGGYGVEIRRGDLTIFRVPGIDQGASGGGRIPTGETIARLLSPPEDQPQQIGHRNSVFCLAFDPTGRTLASGSKDAAAPVVLWDVPAFRPRLVLQGHTREVLTLAFSPDGQRLATAGADGSVRLWDVATGAMVDMRAGNVRQPVPINTLAFSPDGQSIVVGRELGDLYRFDARGLSQVPPIQLPTLPAQGPVEFLTYSPDGKRLAVSIKSDKLDRLEPMALSCDVEVRAMPQGNVIRRWQVPGLVYSLAFSPLGDRLAYSGGTAQSIFVQDTTNLESSPRELKGQGSTPFDLGFTANSEVLGFTRNLFDPANPPRTYEAFDLARRRSLNVSRDQLRRGIDTFGGWSLRGSILNYRLEAVHQDGRRWAFDLSPETERNWWSHTMIPPGPKHPRPTVAVGCESGVVVYDLETGRRTRVFAGHSSPVVSVVPSPDGRWLASSSLDQTMLLYSLDGCDTRPAFGATFQRRPDQVWVVTRVEPRSFAAAMGLIAGDLILKAGIALGQAPPTYYTPENLAEFVGMVDELRPGLDTIALWVRRTVWIPSLGAFEVQMPPMPSTKRNNAALSLMLGTDKEWVFWTPQGFYDTSIEGDSRFLGWHVNSDFRSTRPTDFVPIGTYARTMNQPRILDRLWEGGSLDQALQQAALPAETPTPERQASLERPPRIIFTSVEGGIRLPAPGVVWLVTVPNPRLGLSIQAEGTSRIGTRRVIFDERVLELRPIEAAIPAITENLQVTLVPRRRVRLAVEAASERGTKRTETMDMVYMPPADAAPVPKVEPRLVVLSIGVNRTPNEALLPPVAFADKDAEELARFLSAHLISPDGSRSLQNPKEDQMVLTAEKASERSINQALDRLGEWLRTKRLRKGDIVALVITAHLLEFDRMSVIAASDTDAARKPVPRPVIFARDISERLGELTDYGCRVVLFLDGVHELPNNGLRSSIKSWVRELQRERRVITLVASREGSSGVDVPSQHGFFALGVTRVFQQVVAAGKAGNEPYTLEEFGTAVRQMVLDLSGRQQEAFAYYPRGVPQDSLFARP
jgi:WD40 repeat protein